MYGAIVFSFISVSFIGFTNAEDGLGIAFHLAHPDDPYKNLPDGQYFKKRAAEKQAVAESQKNAKANRNGPPLEPWCYQFTWPGTSGQQNLSLVDTECTGIGKSNPCFQPYVFAWENGQLSDKLPDPESLKQQCTDNVCDPTPWKLASKRKCIKYSYILAGSNEVQNITRFVGVVEEEVTNAGASNKFRPISDGCYQDKTDGSYIREVCVCSPSVGDKGCNSASSISLNLVLLVAAIAFFLLSK